MLVTVVVCTWDRSALLDQTLLAMRELVTPVGVAWELLVVNNNCTDHTDEVISRHAATLPIRRLFESRPGQSNARNLAVAEAKGDLIVWTDDDVLVDPAWLVEYVAAAEARPDVAFFGGTVEPWFEIEPPDWIRSRIGNLGMHYAIKRLGDETMPLPEGQLPVGANMAFRDWALRGRSFDPALGHSAGSMMGWEEVVVLRDLLAEGHTGLWVGSARVKHFIPASRMTPGFIWRRFRDDGRVAARREGPDPSHRAFGAPRWAYRKFASAYLRYRLTRRFGSDGWFESLRKSAYAAGLIVETRAASSEASSVSSRLDPSPPVGERTAKP